MKYEIMQGDKFYVVALDPGVDEGAAVFMDSDMNIHHVQEWKTSSQNPYRFCVACAVDMTDFVRTTLLAIMPEEMLTEKGQYPRFDTDENWACRHVILVHEGVYVQTREKAPPKPKKGVQLALGIADSKLVLPTEPKKMTYNPLPAIELSKSIGIWIASFPLHVHSVNVQRWRSAAGIPPRTKREQCKEQSVAIAAAYLGPESPYVKGLNDHVADAYLIGRYWIDRARLTVAAGKNPITHGVIA